MNNTQKTPDKIKEQKYNKGNLIIGLLLFLVGLFLLFSLIIPMIKSILFMFITLIQEWILLTDINFKFIGGCFFFVIYWKILEAFVSIFLKIFNKINDLKIKK